jgi:hypothetical protein
VAKPEKVDRSNDSKLSKSLIAGELLGGSFEGVGGLIGADVERVTGVSSLRT